MMPEDNKPKNVTLLVPAGMEDKEGELGAAFHAMLEPGAAAADPTLVTLAAMNLAARMYVELAAVLGMDDSDMEKTALESFTLALAHHRAELAQGEPAIFKAKA